MTAKVESQYKADKITTGKLIPTIYGFCGKCKALVSRNQYGIDEKCPKCNVWLDWKEK